MCGKQKKNWVAKDIKIPKSTHHVQKMNEVVLLKEGKEHAEKPAGPLGPIAELQQRPSKSEVIRKQKSTMKK